MIQKEIKDLIHQLCFTKINIKRLVISTRRPGFLTTKTKILQNVKYKTNIKKDYLISMLTQPLT